VGKWAAEKAATMAPGNLKADPLKEAYAMGTTRRSTARNFVPGQAAEDIFPQISGLEKQFKTAKRDQFQKLQGEAQQQWSAEAGRQIPSVANSFLAEAAKLQIKGPMASAIGAANRAINEGLAPGSRGLSQVPWEKASPSEQFARIQYAREIIDEPLRAAATGKLALSDRNAIEIGQGFRDTLDKSLKSVPAKVQADDFYKTLKGTEKQFFDPMKFGKGKEAKVDVPMLKSLFGDNPKAYRLREGIETMRATLDKYGDKIPEAAQMRQIVDRYDSLQKIAEDKRLLEGIRQAQGPSSPVAERLASRLRKEGLDVTLFSSPASALNQADEFLKANAMPRLGVNFEQASRDDQNRLIKLLMWQQENPKATQGQMDAQWKQIYKRSK
jgi:hypothetical protein